MHPFHVLLCGLVQGSVRVAPKVASKVIPERSIAFETEFILLPETIEECLGIGGSYDEVIHVRTDIFVMVAVTLSPLQ